MLQEGSKLNSSAALGLVTASETTNPIPYTYAWPSVDNKRVKTTNLTQTVLPVELTLRNFLLL